MSGQFTGSITMLVLIWLALTFGLYAGAMVGFQVNDRENATVEYNPDTYNLTIGNETDNIYEPPDEEDRREMENSTPEWQKQTKANVKAAMPEFNQPPQILPDAVNDPMENYSQNFANNTVENAIGLMTVTGQPTARYVYDNRDWLPEDIVYLCILALQWAPFITMGYLGVKKLRS